MTFARILFLAAVLVLVTTDHASAKAVVNESSKDVMRDEGAEIVPQGPQGPPGTRRDTLNPEERKAADAPAGPPGSASGDEPQGSPGRRWYGDEPQGPPGSRGPPRGDAEATANVDAAADTDAGKATDKDADTTADAAQTLADKLVHLQENLNHLERDIETVMQSREAKDEQDVKNGKNDVENGDKDVNNDAKDAGKDESAPEEDGPFVEQDLGRMGSDDGSKQATYQLSDDVHVTIEDLIGEVVEDELNGGDNDQSKAETNMDDQLDEEEESFDEAEGPVVRAKVTDYEHGQVLRDDEEGEYLRQSRLVSASDEEFVDAAEQAITLDEALVHQTMSASDLTMADLNDPFWNHIVSAVTTVGNGIVSAGTAVGNGIVSVGTAIGTGIVKAAKWTGGVLKGVVKEIAESDIGRFIGKAAMHIFEFVKCMVPFAELLEKCTKEAITSLANSGGDYFEMGHSSAGCLKFSGSNTASKSMGPVTASATVTRDAGLKLRYYLNSGKMQFTLYGKVQVQPKVEIAVDKDYSKEHYKRRVPLTKFARTVFRKMVVVTVAGVPIPCLLEIKVQPVARVKVYQDSAGSGKLTFDLQKAAEISLDGATITYNPTSSAGPTAHASASHNLNDLKIAKNLVLQGETTLSGSVSVGPEITAQINGVPLKLFPNIQFELAGTVWAKHQNHQTCIGGELKFSTSLAMLIIPDISKLTSISRNFGDACVTMTHMQCTYNPLVKTGQCAAKLLSGGAVDPCAEMMKGCKEMEKQLEVIPNPITNNPILATIDLLRRGLSPIKFGQATCTGTHSKTTVEDSCVDNHKWCSFWAGIGECSKNPAYMTPNCKKSCKTGSCVEDPCQDKNDQCAGWARRGECEVNPDYMLVNCPRSCDYCGTSKCKNNNINCVYWARIGECKKNPNYMKPNCKKACNECEKSYMKTDAGQHCERKDQEITTATECKAAGIKLGFKWAHSWNGHNDFPACLRAEDGRNTIYFNTSPSPKRNGVNPKYAAICKN